MSPQRNPGGRQPSDGSQLQADSPVFPVLEPESYHPFFDRVKSSFLNPLRRELERKITDNLSPQRSTLLSGWKAAISGLPVQPAANPSVSDGSLMVDFTPSFSLHEESLLRDLMPWRKGPWNFGGIQIETEWRSDWKWDRLSGHIEPLRGRRVLDVGCGNGYHCWRMHLEGADTVIGLEPHLLNVAQSALMQRWYPESGVAVLPLSLEEYPSGSRSYDSVFSMGVLYHRRSPADHLLDLKSCLRPDGQLILETLVVPGDENTVLLPRDRYAKMRNVWYLPSADHMLRLLERCGFRQARLVHLGPTSLDEQRRTDWMRFESLADYLDPDDNTLTIEGYPAPVRAIFTARG